MKAPVEPEIMAFHQVYSQLFKSLVSVIFFLLLLLLIYRTLTKAAIIWLKIQWKQ